LHEIPAVTDVPPQEVFGRVFADQGHHLLTRVTQE
jgi:hypothetical protein